MSWMRGGAWCGWLLLVLGGLALCAGCKRPEDGRTEVAPAAVKGGRLLFQRGQSAHGQPLTGYLGPERVELSGEVAACARCHGPTGRGSREGGVEVPDITPGSLGHVRTQAVRELEDHSRPAYTRDTLLRAITEGVSASGRPLGVAMPRYALGDSERGELLAYLQQLGEAPDPGLSATTVTVGAALPLSGRQGPLGQEVAAVVRAVFAEVNARGGIFRRKLELVVEDDAALYGDTASPAGPDATARLVERDVFALVASLRPGPLPSDALLAREGISLVLPLTLGGGTSVEDGPIFFLYPEEAALARLAVQHLAGVSEPELRRHPLAVAHTGTEAGRAWAEAVRSEAGRRELAAPVEWKVGDPAGLEAAMKQASAAPPFAVLYLGTPEGLSALARGLDAHAAKVPVFAPAALADPSVLGPSAGRVTFLYPAGLGERAPELEELAAFMERHGLKPSHPAFQLGAYAAARVLVEALTRAGADVTRAGLQQQLESLRDFDTGVSPPITFGLNRHVGVQGAQLAKLEPTTGRLVAVSGWLPLSP